MTRRGGDAPGLVAVAATYVYFLLFAQYGFLRLVESRLAGVGAIHAVMLAMGVAGLLASLATARFLRGAGERTATAAGFLGCGATAALAPWCGGLVSLVLVAAVIGASTGLLTVALAAGLRDRIRGRGFGLRVGVATGAAYAFCNVPPVFEAAPVVQSAVVAAVAIAGMAAVLVDRRPLAAPPPASGGGPTPADARGLGFATVVVSFLALIWLDSAAFVTIQETVALKGSTWGSPGQKIAIGVAHLAAAAAAGYALDRGLFRSLLLGTYALFVTSFTMLGTLERVPGLTGPIYAIGISTYSVALVAYPAWCRDEPGSVPVRWRAGAVFGVAGWLGSALGVGMAQDLHTIPTAFMVAAGVALGGGWLVARGRRGATRAAAVVALAAVLAALGTGGAGAADDEPDPAAVARGREVYIDEGCINCHSQFVRPLTHDVEWWGPARPIDPAETPPLIGMRRQGPDLLNVGNRRSAVWQRLHLLDPRSISPGSRMPSYRYLFDDGDTRGADLVAYLTSLGRSTGRSRFLTREAYAFSVPVEQGLLASGRRLFASYCVPCHGANGRGDGPLAGNFRPEGLDLGKPQLIYVPAGPGGEPLPEDVMRVVKFGIPSTSMAGHEYLGDHAVADLARRVLEIRADAADHR